MESHAREFDHFARDVFESFTGDGEHGSNRFGLLPTRIVPVADNAAKVFGASLRNIGQTLFCQLECASWYVLGIATLSRSRRMSGRNSGCRMNAIGNGKQKRRMFDKPGRRVERHA